MFKFIHNTDKRSSVLFASLLLWLLLGKGLGDRGGAGGCMLFCVSLLSCHMATILPEVCVKGGGAFSPMKLINFFF